MGMLPDIHVNFGQLTFEKVYQTFLPLVPGGTLVGGLIVTNPQRVHDISLALGLGRYAMLAVLLYSIYIVGLILYGFSAVVTGICSAAIVFLVPKVKIRNRPSEAASKSWVWRCVAGEFLGQTLSPSPITVPGAPPAYRFDVEWEDLYNILQDYVLRGVAILSNEIYLLFTYLQAAGWGLLYLYWRTALRGHWSILIVSIPLIIFGATMPVGANVYYLKYDRLTPWDFTSRLIREIKSRQSNVPPPPTT
jgi:hypothetical protein